MRTAGEVKAGRGVEAAQVEAGGVGQVGASPRDRQEWGMGGSIHTAA